MLQPKRTKYRKVHQNVYAPKDLALTAHTRAEAAWLWSGRSATLAGYSAAAMLVSRWLPDDAPAELARVRYPSPTGIRVHSGAVAHDEVTVIGAMDCTTVARTCYDIGRARRVASVCGSAFLEQALPIEVELSEELRARLRR